MQIRHEFHVIFSYFVASLLMRNQDGNQMIQADGARQGLHNNTGMAMIKVEVTRERLGHVTLPFLVQFRLDASSYLVVILTDLPVINIIVSVHILYPDTNILQL